MTRAYRRMVFLGNPRSKVPKTETRYGHQLLFHFVKVDLILEFVEDLTILFFLPLFFFSSFFFFTDIGTGGSKDRGA